MILVSVDVFSGFPADSVKAMERCWKGQLSMLGCVPGPVSCSSAVSPELRAPRALLRNALVSHTGQAALNFHLLSPPSISLCRASGTRVNIWRRSFTGSVVDHWNRLLIAPSLSFQGTFVVWFSVRSSCEEQGVGLEDPYGSLSTWDLLWFYKSFVKMSSNCWLLLHGSFLNASRQLYAHSQWVCMCTCLSVEEKRLPWSR